MQEVLSDTRLPDPGQLITQSRLNTLRLQVEQLKNHKRNLCQEIEGCEARHQAKVQRIREESERFRVEYQKITTARPVITESQFAEMIVKAKHDMQREEEDRKTRYFAELEIRRRRQQQRQQREAEILESGRRRQLLHQQQLQQAHIRSNQAAPLHSDPNIQFSDPPLERLVTQDKRDDTNSQPSQKLPANSANSLNPTNHLKGAPELGQEANPMLYPPGMGNAFSQPVTQGSLQRFPQSGHTQHHYPPPPHYLPSTASPAIPPGIIHQRSPLPNMQQASQNNTGKPNTAPVGRIKKVPSSASSTSSASSASSTSSKKKKLDSDLAKDATLCTTNQDMRERPISQSSEGVVDHTKSGDFGMTPGQSSEFQQGSTTQSRQLITSQYQSVPAPTNPAVAAHMSGAPVQTPYCYEIGIANPPNPSLPSGPYYHQPVSVSNPSGYSHPRPQFSQHTPYNAVQYHLVPPQPSSEHPPPPPMYIQHMPQQPHVPQPGPPMVGPTQHSSSHIPPQQHSPSSWHHSGPPPYPHYGPSRYSVPGGSMGYPMQAPRNFGPNSSGYSMPHYLVGQHGSQVHPHPNISSVPVSLQDGSGASQPIPAPPPYQQQQPGSVVSYWPTQQQVPPDYTQSQHPPNYLPGSQTEPVIVPNQQTLSSVDNVHPGTTMSVSYADVGMGQVVPHQSQGANIYYSGGPIPPYAHGNNLGPSGFYSVPPQHYAPHQHSGHSWSGYSNSGPPQIQAYPQSQQHPHHQSPQCSSSAYSNSQMTKLDQTAAAIPADNSAGVGASGGSSSRPPSTNDK
ncbi:hypothetical protein MN116_003229 [Schistosoma mekongi]|uniref:Uncharacterized protein n=1 Tax=Schistosoma mekongi TaxID=38744 RepID=A0AAE2D735_SCHME|nr:hypothetical protein MN116_003229 [Schistosoma mekongi]